jgi:hypothetical protein
MNKLTTIETIKRAAPLALLAVVMSGSAFAKGPKKDPQVSIDVFTLCDVVERYDYDSQKNLQFFTATTTVSNTSDDTPGSNPGASVDAQITKIEMQGKYKTRGKETDLGGPVSQSYPIVDGYGNVIEDGIVEEYPDTLEKTLEINICDVEGFDHTRDASLNAEITVWVDGAKFDTYGGKCDDDPSDNYLMACTDPATQTCDENEEYVLDAYGDPIVVYGPDQSNVSYDANACY